MAVTMRKRKLKNGKTKTSYQASIYVDGCRVATRTFDTKGAAYLWQEKEKPRHESGEVYTEEARRICFDELITLYEQHTFANLRKTTKQAKANRLRNLRGSPLQKVVVSELTGRHVGVLLGWLRNQPTATAPGRISFKEELKMLSSILGWYREEYDASFVVPITRRHYKESAISPRVRRPDYFLKPAELSQWLTWLECNRPDPVYHQLGLFMALTGFRLGEATGLCWDAIDLEAERPSVRVVRTLTWDYRTKEARFVEDAKTSSSIRYTMLPPVLVQLLRHIRTTRPFVIEGQRPVFTNSQGRLLRDNTIRENFNAGFKACNLDYSGTHILRHTAATLALQATGDMSAVQANLGHGDIRQTQEYAKVVAIAGNDVPGRTAEFLGLTSYRSR